MIALPATLLKILLSTILLTAIIPFILSTYKGYKGLIFLSCVTACFIESMGIAYFYIYSGRASWKLASMLGFDIGFTLEPLGIVLTNLLTGLWVVSSLYVINYPNKINGTDQAKSFAILGLIIFSSVFVILSKNLFSMFFAYEMIRILTVISAPANSLRKAILIQSLTSLIFIYFILCVYYMTGSTEFILGGILPKELPIIYIHLLLLGAIFGIVQTIIFQVNIFLKNDVIDTSLIVSLFQTLIIINLGLFSLLKIIIYIFGIEYLTIAISGFNWPIILSILYLIYALYKSINSRIIHHILTYSILSGTAIVLTAIFTLTQKSIMGAISHIVAQSFSEITLFFIACRFYTYSKSVRVEELKGLAYQFPIAAILFIIASLPLIGLHTFSATNDIALILESLIEPQPNYILLSVITFSIIATIFYLGRFVCFFYIRTKKTIHKQNISALDLITGLSTICIVTFPIVEKFLNSLLWSIL